MFVHWKIYGHAQKTGSHHSAHDAMGLPFTALRAGHARTRRLSRSNAGLRHLESSQALYRKGRFGCRPILGSGNLRCVQISNEGRGFDFTKFIQKLKLQTRALPMPTVVLISFADPPYSDNLKYSDDERCIGRLSAFKVGILNRWKLCSTSFSCAKAPSLPRCVRGRCSTEVRVCTHWCDVHPHAVTSFEVVDHVCVRRNKHLQHGSRRAEAVDNNRFMRATT